MIRRSDSCAHRYRIVCLLALLSGCSIASRRAADESTGDWQGNVKVDRHCAEVQTQAATLLATVSIDTAATTCTSAVQTTLLVANTRYADLERCELRELNATTAARARQLGDWRLVAERTAGDRLTLADEALRRGCLAVAESIFRHVLTQTLPLLRRQQGLAPQVNAYAEHARSGLQVARKGGYQR